MNRLLLLALLFTPSLAFASAIPVWPFIFVPTVMLVGAVWAGVYMWKLSSDAYENIFVRVLYSIVASACGGAAGFIISVGMLRVVL